MSEKGEVKYNEHSGTIERNGKVLAFRTPKGGYRNGRQQGEVRPRGKDAKRYWFRGGGLSNAEAIAVTDAILTQANDVGGETLAQDISERLARCESVAAIADEGGTVAAGGEA